MKFARQAELNGKNTSWGLFEDTPSSLVKEVKKVQEKKNKHEADRRLAQARELFEKKAHNDNEKAGFLDKAKLLAKQSEALHGEYSMWDLGDRPASLIKEIDAARMKLKVTVARQPAPKQCRRNRPARPPRIILLPTRPTIQTCRPPCVPQLVRRVECLSIRLPARLTLARKMCWPGTTESCRSRTINRCFRTTW